MDSVGQKGVQILNINTKLQSQHWMFMCEVHCSEIMLFMLSVQWRRERKAGDSGQRSDPVPRCSVAWATREAALCFSLSASLLLQSHLTSWPLSQRGEDKQSHTHNRHKHTPWTSNKSCIKNSFWEYNVLPHSVLCVVYLNVYTIVFLCYVCSSGPLWAHIKSKHWFLAQQDVGINPKQLCFFTITLATSDIARHLALEFISPQAQKHV